MSALGTVNAGVDWIAHARFYLSLRSLTRANEQANTGNHTPPRQNHNHHLVIAFEPQGLAQNKNNHLSLETATLSAALGALPCALATSMVTKTASQLSQHGSSTAGQIDCIKRQANTSNKANAVGQECGAITPREERQPKLSLRPNSPHLHLLHPSATSANTLQADKYK